MKNLIKLSSLLTILFLFSIHCSAAEPVQARAFFVDFQITTDLITAEPCLSKDGMEIEGYSATIRVNVLVVLNSTPYLVASQIVNIPCGTVINQNMTRSEFDNITTLVGSEGVSFITDYLDENDENEIKFNEIKKSLHSTLISIKL